MNSHSLQGKSIQILLNAYNARAVIEQLNPVLERQLEELAGWVERGSGWVVEGVEKAYHDIARYNPIRGGHYLPLPKDLQAKNAIINIKNKDNQCIRWGLKAALFPVSKDPQRPSKYPIDDGLDFTGISFSTLLSASQRNTESRKAKQHCNQCSWV